MWSAKLCDHTPHLCACTGVHEVLCLVCSRYVEDGVLDAGICGKDWIVENEADVVEVPWP